MRAPRRYVASILAPRARNVYGRSRKPSRLLSGCAASPWSGPCGESVVCWKGWSWQTGPSFARSLLFGTSRIARQLGDHSDPGARPGGPLAGAAPQSGRWWSVCSRHGEQRRHAEGRLARSKQHWCHSRRARSPSAARVAGEGCVPTYRSRAVLRADDAERPGDLSLVPGCPRVPRRGDPQRSGRDGLERLRERRVGRHDRADASAHRGCSQGARCGGGLEQGRRIRSRAINDSGERARPNRSQLAHRPR